jgi:hypothetical protein
MKTFYEQTIIDAIDFSGYEDDADIFGDYPLYTDIQNIYFIFKKEYGFMIERVGEMKAFSEWLSGLPSVLTVPFYYNEMIQNAKDFGLVIKDEDEFCNNYFNRLSQAFFTLKENL